MRWGALLMVLVGACASRTEVRTSHDPEANFRRLKTYTWAARSETGDPEIDDARLETRLKEFADRELAVKGYRAVEAEPDFLVIHHVVMQRKRRGAGEEEYSGIWREGYTPNVPADGGDQSESRYYVASLLLEFREPESRRLLWTATAESEVNMRAPQEARDVKLRQAVRKMLASFPP